MRLGGVTVDVRLIGGASMSNLQNHYQPKCTLMVYYISNMYLQLLVQIPDVAVFHRREGHMYIHVYIPYLYIHVHHINSIIYTFIYVQIQKFKPLYSKIWITWCRGSSWRRVVHRPLPNRGSARPRSRPVNQKFEFKSSHKKIESSQQQSESSQHLNQEDLEVLTQRTFWGENLIQTEYEVRRLDTGKKGPVYLPI